jgi:hypothetical protein
MFYFIINWLLTICVFFAPLTMQAEDKPFWRTKEKAMDKITRERAIIVSVKAEEVKVIKKRRLTMVAGGQVNAPVQKAFAIATDYNRLKEVSDHFKEVKFDPATHQLYVHGVAFNYHARMYILMKENIEDANNPRIEWRVVKGEFLGMQGHVSFENYQNKSLMGLYANYEAEKLPLPEFFIEFALEVVIQRVGTLMRSFIEKNADKITDKMPVEKAKSA